MERYGVVWWRGVAEWWCGEMAVCGGGVWCVVWWCGGVAVKWWWCGGGGGGGGGGGVVW